MREDSERFFLLGFVNTILRACRAHAGGITRFLSADLRSLISFGQARQALAQAGSSKFVLIKIVIPATLLKLRELIGRSSAFQGVPHGRQNLVTAAR
jgi:hypothetical protein